MTIKNLLQHLHSTPQSEKLLGSAQVCNSASGYVWPVDVWEQLDRFLILGSDGGSYYATERRLTLENATGVLNCLAQDGPRTVARIVEISRSGRAPKNDPAIFALALALKKGDLPTRRAARAAVPEVCRIGTHLFALASAVKVLGGWGRITQGAFADWYTVREPSELAYQAVKYQGRHGWTGRDLLRKAHVTPPSRAHEDVYKWMVGGWSDVPELPPPGLERIWAFEKAKRAKGWKEVVELITEHRLPRECVPTRWLKDRRIWDALLVDMPFTAMIRNLAKMSVVGLTEPLSDALKTIVDRLGDAERLKRARVHPLSLLNTLTTYRRGRGVRGKNTWKVNLQIVSALDAAFYTAFEQIEPTGARWMLGLDVSGSMTCGQLSGMPALSPRVGAAAMAMVTARTEASWMSYAFADRFIPLEISPHWGLEEVVKRTSGLPFGGTDCALPMVHAREKGLEVDVFVIYTDSETWHGTVHPVQALRAYRQSSGIAAKLIVVGMVSNGFTIADPDDAGMLDVVGFDAAAPALMSQFARS